MVASGRKQRVADGAGPALRWSPANRDRSDEQFLAVLGVPPQALATSVSDTRSSLRCSSGVMVLGHGEEVARDAEGDLVMMSGERRVNPGQISLWCGDGCQGIPLGRSFRHAWRRWAPLKSPPAVAADRNDGRFEAPAWSAAANWRSDPQGDGPWRSALVPTLPQGVHLNELRMAGDHAAAVLSADSVDALTAALRAIDESRAFTAADVRRFSGRSGQPMTVGVLLERIDLLRSTRSAPAASMPPAVPSGPASADPMQGVRADVDAALPSGAVVEALSPAPRARGFVLRIRTTRDRAAGELMAALWKYHCDAVECLSICVPGYPPGVYEIGLRRQAALAS